MLGAIAGDIVGSVYEGNPVKTTDFLLFHDLSTFTDDTVLTIATADALLHERDYALSYRNYAEKYPDAGYGGAFHDWMLSPSAGPYHSWGNGSAMRVSPVGFAFDSPQEVVAEAKRNAEVTHNHPEGVKGAQATALAVFLARKGETMEAIREEITGRFHYDLGRSLEKIRPAYRFDVSCQGSVPESIIAFLESTSVEDAIRKAISLGGDSDTMACIAGGIAQAYYKDIPVSIVHEVRRRLPDEFLAVLDDFNSSFDVA